MGWLDPIDDAAPSERDRALEAAWATPAAPVVPEPGDVPADETPTGGHAATAAPGPTSWSTVDAATGELAPSPPRPPIDDARPAPPAATPTGAAPPAAPAAAPTAAAPPTAPAATPIAAAPPSAAPPAAAPPPATSSPATPPPAAPTAATPIAATPIAAAPSAAAPTAAPLAAPPATESTPQAGTQLNPAQEDVLAALGARPDERPAFDPRLRAELRAELEDRLGPVAAALPDKEQLWISKHAISSVMGCEGKYVAEEELPFAWSTATARGVVSHKAIELSVHWRGDPAPGLLVDEAIAALINSSDNVAAFLGGLSEAERAELRSGATERVTMFVECFPPLEARWRPVTEARLRADLCNDRIVLRGKVDLTVGRPDGVRAGKVLLDLKTGGFAPAHREDLRFYALLETLRLGTPPRSVASYYLDGGRLQVEAVSEDVLQAALERTVAAAETMVALRAGARAPVLKPGPPCRWCPALPTCPTGTAHLEEREVAEGW